MTPPPQPSPTATATPRGLTSAEAEARLARHGPNQLERVETGTLWRSLVGALREPMFLFLIAAAVLYFALGDRVEGAFMIAAAALSISLVAIQQVRSERALAALKRLSEPSARVIRDGEQIVIAARDLVPGDVVLVGEGQRAPADIVLRGGDALGVDESILTGEAAPVSKHAQLDPDDDGARLFAGTTIVRGQALGEVERTGAATRLGAIGGALAGTMRELTPLQKSTGALVARLGAIALIFCVLVAFAHGLLRDAWVEGAFAGLTLAIALLPEEFPMVLAVFLALGAWRLARHNVLVRRAAATEGLGAVTMLCVDKTGTLTENRMSVAAVWAEGALHEGEALNAEPARRVLGKAFLASAEHPVDPMDRAIHRAWPSPPEQDEAKRAAFVRGFPLRPDLLAVTQVWRMPDGRLAAAAKGAPEAIFSLCRLAPDAETGLRAPLAALARAGMRVLAVAALDPAPDGFDDPRTQHFTFLGLVAFRDPLRADAPAALREARGAGIQVAMITGDYPETAIEIARQAGIDIASGVMTGQEIDALDRDELAARIQHVRVFARVKPEEKLRLVEAFKADGHVVAMTGDGVNDAPALKAAHIGIAMGQRGADVARDAADIILLDDNFASIVGGIRLGRRIFANLRKALTYIMAIHVPIAGLALCPLLFGLPPLFFPMHVVLIELVVDPVCSLAFEGERSEARAMTRPPRARRESLFGRRQMALALTQGAVLFGVVLALYAVALTGGVGEQSARTQAFVALIIGNLALALSESDAGGALLRGRLAFWSIAGAALIVLATLILLPVSAGALGMTPLPPPHLLLALGVGALGGGWYGVANRLRASLVRGRALAAES